MAEGSGTEFVYRLATPGEWLTAQETGVVPARDIDRRDGYMHLSTREQTLETARLHFADALQVLALEIPLAGIASNVKFELAPKRGEGFPHLYGDLLAEHVTRAFQLEWNGDGFSFGAAL